MARSLLLLAAALALTAAPALAQSPAVVTHPDQVFVDSAGSAHRWSINVAHTLIWDSKPYIPVGGMFFSRYLFDSSSEANWDADVKSLAAISEAGITDIYINGVKPASDISSDKWQRLIDHLEKQGFRYGIQLADVPKAPLAGWVVRPNVYRLPKVTRDQEISLDIQGLIGGVWFLTKPKSSDIVSAGSLKPVDGKCSISVRSGESGERTLLVYPLKRVDPLADGLPNLWDGYDDYRDGILNNLKKLKLGAGMRFWVDPFVNEMGMRGETSSMVPESAAYAVEFEAWLRKKYSDLSALQKAWALGSQLNSFERAAQLLPLWNKLKGLPYVYDRRNGETIKLSSDATAMWDDIEAFQQSSIARYLNEAAACIKREVANVPVVLKWTASDGYLTKARDGGFDGLGVEAYGMPDVIGPFAGAQCLALVEQASRPMWLITTETQTTSEPVKEHPGYRTRDELDSSLNALKDSGSKGFFVFGFNLAPPWDKFDLAAVPEQLGWLAQYRDRLKSEQMFAEWRPRAVWFSRDNPCGADLARLERDLWWLPTQAESQLIETQPQVRAYSIRDAQGTAVYLWSTGGPKTLELPLPEGVKPEITFTGIEPREAKFSKRKVEIPLTREPVVVRGISASNFATSDFLLMKAEYLGKLLGRAEEKKLMVGQYKSALDNATAMIKMGQLKLAESSLDQAIAELEPILTPFYWQEGEAATEHSFDGASYNPGASGLYYLKLDSPHKAPLAATSASYAVFASSEGEYDIWLAGTPVGEQGAPGISWNIDESNWVAFSGTASEKPYAPGLAWTKLARVHLAAGKHVVRIRIDSPRASDKRYVFGIDAVVVTREPFQPQGTRRPELQ